MDVDEDLLRRAEQRIGTVLRGKYHIDGVLGVGGMAVVYAATHRNQKRFAVKVLHPELSARREVSTRFLREGYAANSVRHPGAVAVLDDDVAEDGAAFLVMELLEGTNVEVLCARAGHRLALRDALCITHELLDVLGAAHANAVVHRDIKPSNLLVLPDGQLKVLDFGIARVRDMSTSSQPATRTGSTLGTPAFMAPEQALGQAADIDAQTDVWAAGATLFTMISGRLVHEGANAQQVLVRAATTPARPITAVAADVPPEVAHLVAKALAFDKASRWLSAAAMRDAVNEVYEKLFAEPPSRRPLAMLSGGLGVAATAVAERAQVPTPAREPVQAQLGFATTAASTGGSELAPKAPAITTAAPVSSRQTPPVVEPPQEPPRARLALRVLAAVGLLAVGAGGVLVVRGALRSDASPEENRATVEHGPSPAATSVPVPVAASGASGAVLPAASTAPPAPAAIAAVPPAAAVPAAQPSEAPRATAPAAPSTASPVAVPRLHVAPVASGVPSAPAPAAPSPALAPDAGPSRAVAPPRNPLDMILK